jgi:hypothetical protein
MKTLIAAGLLALGGLMTTAVGVANADEVQVEGVYSTGAACEIEALTSSSNTTTGSTPTGSAARVPAHSGICT